MKVALVNLPWYRESDPMLWGVRAGSRWPHFQQRAAPDALPRYVPFPFFMAIAAAVLKGEGHDVLLVDAVAEGIDYEACYRKIEAFEPGLIFAETSTPSLSADLAALAELRRRCPGVVLVCGGTHAPGLVPDIIRSGGIPDYWIAGEYEQSLALLVARLELNHDVTDVPGLISATGRAEALASIVDVDSLPSPLFDQLPVRNYSDPVCGLPAPVAQGWLSRGCPFHCTFCVWPQVIYGSRAYRQRRIDSALDEVQMLISRHGCESFYFDDDTANIGERRMKELADGIIQRGLDKYPWAMMARADCMTPAMIGYLAGAGMYSVKYGVESISPALLNACEKGTDLEKLKKAIKFTKDAGIKTHLTFTFGVPGETLDTIRQTLDFALECAPETAQFSVCTPFPGTVFYDECVKNGWLVTDDWARFVGSGDVVVSTPMLSAGDLKQGYEDACSAWRRFTEQRLDEKKRGLLSRLKAAIAGGGRWTLIGDRDAAGFLMDAGSGVAPAYVEDAVVLRGATGVVTVIVSRHDEEKLFRRLIRAGGLVEGNTVMRLYG